MSHRHGLQVLVPLGGMPYATSWTESDRTAFAEAVGLHGHTQGECAERLRVLGATSADQSSVSKWATGRIQRPSASITAAIRKYIDESPGDGMSRVLTVPSQAKVGRGEDDVFDESVRELTNEPLLGPRQAALVDAIIERLRSGSPMSEADNDARIAAARLLRLDT